MEPKIETRALGKWKIHAIQAGGQKLDGGAMFGVVPKPLWERRIAADEKNRIQMGMRCLLVEHDRGLVLIDSGLGNKETEKFHQIYGIENEGAEGRTWLEDSLKKLGVAPRDVMMMIDTHLHFDHAGGTTRRGPGGRLALSFPRATHHVQRRAWQWAHAPSERDAGSFLSEDFDLLQHSNQLHLVEGEVELFPDVELVVSDGHTPAQQLPRFHGDGTHVTFCGDVVPTRAHLRPSWVTGYDLQPVTTLEEKKMLLAEALEDDGVLVLEHDAEVAACRVAERDGAIVFRAAVEL